MSEGSRHRIFTRLHAATRQPPAPVSLPPELPIKTYSQKEKIEKLKTLMEAMRTEVHLSDAKNWVNTVEDILKKREVKSLLYAPPDSHRRDPGTSLGQRRR